MKYSFENKACVKTGDGRIDYQCFGKGEYTWNDNATPVKASTVNNGGMGSERLLEGYVFELTVRDKS